MEAAITTPNSNVKFHMPIDFCSLCLSTADLRDSHIIPNAYFKEMKRERSGQLVAIDDSVDTMVRHSNESRSEPPLCAACEKALIVGKRGRLKPCERQAKQ